jgi:Tfp pilus assembly protein PilN
MIKINLLESITDKPTSAAVVVEKKVSNPSSRFFVLTGVVAALLVLGIGLDYLWASSTKSAADEELAKQQQIAKQLEAVIKEQADLDAKIKDIEQRVNAIKELRAAQAGPSAVLQALTERIVGAPGLYLESVEQKGDTLTIKGNSPNEYTVTNFGRSLEFSSGLFSNLNIETQRKELAATQVQAADGSSSVQLGTPDGPKPETVNFTIKCAYTPSKANQSPLPGGQQTANNAQSANQPVGNPTQVAKN